MYMLSANSMSFSMRELNSLRFWHRNRKKPVIDSPWLLEDTCIANVWYWGTKSRLWSSTGQHEKTKLM